MRRHSGWERTEEIMQSNRESIAQVLRAHKVFRHLTDEALHAISDVSRVMDVGPGECFGREGDESKDVYLLVSGTAAAVRDTGNGTLVVLSSIPAGDCIGELAFLDGGRRTASVRAETQCKLIDIPAAAVRLVPNASSVVGELKGALATVLVSRARTMSDDMLSSLQRQLDAKTLQNQFGYFLVFTISLFLISSALFYHVTQGHVKNIYDPSFSWQTVFLFAIPCLIIIKSMKIPLSELGVKRDGLWK